MPQSDLPLDQLERYRPTRVEPEDFDRFWANTLGDARSHDLAPRSEPVDNGLRLIEAFDVTYHGFAGQPIKAWLAVPANAEGPLPCVVEFPGYGGGRGLAHDLLLFAAAGYAHLYMDMRGQGSTWRSGHTPDQETRPGNPHHPGFLTRGVLDPETYYYRRVATDAVRAVEAARASPMVDPDRIAVTGGSQGGGVALMVAGLMPGLAAVMCDVPFLCDFQRAVAVATADPYLEIERYLKVHRDRVGDVFRTLSYLDGVNFATRATAPALFSVGLLDEVCPPSTVYAAYHHYRGPKAIEPYRFNGHEGGQTFHDAVKLRFLRDTVG